MGPHCHEDGGDSEEPSGQPVSGGQGKKRYGEGSERRLHHQYDRIEGVEAASQIHREREEGRIPRIAEAVRSSHVRTGQRTGEYPAMNDVPGVVVVLGSITTDRISVDSLQNLGVGDKVDAEYERQ